MNRELKREMIGAAVWGAIVFALTVVAIYAHRAGDISRDTLIRIVTGPTGLWMVWYGNRIPKNVVPGARAGQAQRVAAWSMVLSGIVFAGLWAFAPISVAATVGTGVILAGVVSTLAYCLWTHAGTKAA